MDMQRMMVDGEAPILTCQAIDCSYNNMEICHAGQIEVGDDHAKCDTYTHTSVSLSDAEPCVSKCHITECYFNESMGCHASGVTVATHAGHADCLTVRNAM